MILSPSPEPETLPEGAPIAPLLAVTSHTLPEQENALVRARAFAEPLIADETSIPLKLPTLLTCETPLEVIFSVTTVVFGAEFSRLFLV